MTWLLVGGAALLAVITIAASAAAPKATFGQGGVKSVRTKGTAVITDYGDGSELVIAPTASWQLDSRGVQTIVTGTQHQADAITDAWKAGLTP